VRWYPPTWRRRYGEEFSALLADEWAEEARSWRRTANVVGSGLRARLATTGLAGPTLAPADQARAGLATLGLAVAVFVCFGTAMWAQLTIGWQWAAPDTVGTAAGMIVMSVVMVLFVGLALLAAIPVGLSVIRRMVAGRGAGLGRPTTLFLAGAVLFVAGARHFGNGWPGTGGHPWAHQGLVPGGVAAFLWAGTLSISSYWAHPGALGSFPVAELAWMVVSPLALAAMAVGITKIVRRLDMSAALLRYEGRLGRVAGAAMAAFLAGSLCWVVDGGPGPGNLFHAGAIDSAGLTVMVGALLVAHRAGRRAHRAGVVLSGR
jgi:hypothetical protein